MHEASAPIGTWKCNERRIDQQTDIRVYRDVTLPTSTLSIYTTDSPLRSLFRDMFLILTPTKKIILLYF